MDAIKYHGSSETQTITCRSILIRMQICYQVHVDVIISVYACIMFYIQSLQLLI